MPRTNSTARHVLAPASAILAFGALSACGVEPRGGVRPVATNASNAERCMFQPVILRIHPLTRLQRRENGSSTIDAHIEFRDDAGDEVKAAGRLGIELYRESGPVVGAGERLQVARWEEDLTDPERNSRAYDRVTRTYRFELSGVPTASGEQGLTLRATLNLAGGTRLSDQITINR